MNCPTCQKPLKRDRNYGETQTMMAYGSPEGHNHDDNCRRRKYVCEDGHAIFPSVVNKCHACKWEGKRECFCCGKKLDWWPDEQAQDRSELPDVVEYAPEPSMGFKFANRVVIFNEKFLENLNKKETKE